MAAGRGDFEERLSLSTLFCNELIERLAPPVAEAHAIVRIAILLVLMHGKRGVFRSFSVRRHHDDRGEGRNIEGGIGWPVPGPERHGPDELAVRHDLEEAADIRYVLAFRRCRRGEGRFRNRPFSTAPA